MREWRNTGASYRVPRMDKWEIYCPGQKEGVPVKRERGRKRKERKKERREGEEREREKEKERENLSSVICFVWTLSQSCSNHLH